LAPVVFACRRSIELERWSIARVRDRPLVSLLCAGASPRRRILNRSMLWVSILAVLAAWPIAPAHAETPAAFCARIGNDGALRPIPESLVAAAGAALGTSMPRGVAMKTTVFRCANRRVLVCTVGANLVCGRANTSRTPGRGQIDWCREHHDDAFIPAVATGHDTIYAWRCQDGVPRIVRQTLDVDARGFVVQNWQQLP